MVAYFPTDQSNCKYAYNHEQNTNKSNSVTIYHCWQQLSREVADNDVIRPR